MIIIDRKSMYRMEKTLLDLSQIGCRRSGGISRCLLGVCGWEGGRHIGLLAMLIRTMYHNALSHQEKKRLAQAQLGFNAVVGAALRLGFSACAR